MLRTVLYAGVLVVLGAACERAKPPAASGDGEAGQAVGAQRAEADGGTSAPLPVVRDASTEPLDVPDARAPAATPFTPPADGRPELWDESFATACRSTRPLCPNGECETLATVLDSARQHAQRSPVYVNRDHCQDAGGTKYTIATEYGLPTVIHLFRADTGELVSRIVSHDIPDFCSREGGPMSHIQITGALIPECTWADDDATAFCSDGDEPNVHVLETCLYRFLPEPIYAPDGGLIWEWVPPAPPSIPGPDAGPR